ncbi:hypothetical protein GM418_28325 [Maribellus comscasis]|uniref:Uncharacterized protein n=1 Tax=Maribellus comscasis TaxID=2681766 RepID=A0A6I6K708_9BACT|nr:hypothetical protein [Maribellus comscasis]QGY47433.1 hypothetical protein GM418_28325 [Maribellus comscasis]
MEELTVGTRVDHPRYGEGIVSKNNLTAYEIFFERGGKIEITKRNTDLKVIQKNEEVSAKTGLTIAEIEKVMSYVLDQYGALNEVVPLGEKWKGGTMLLQPANKELKPKEIPAEAFFHKIVMLRDRLRVLEQNINSHSVLTDEEKVNIQQYITRIYGSLTTFNILFSEKEHYFVGSKSK